jgi:hypothetical protein
LPELQTALENTQVGSHTLSSSRFGVHLIKVEEKDNNGESNALRLHLRQIFLGGGDFEQWFKEETKNYKVKEIIKI